MSTSTRRREPLQSLPLSHYIHPSNSFPSPISLPLKRPSSSTSHSTSEQTVKVRKVERERERDSDSQIQIQTIRLNRVKEVTPKAREVLERDELGVGRSPARRLFVGADDGVSRGISGAVPTPPSNPSTSSTSSSTPTTPNLPHSTAESIPSPLIQPSDLESESNTQNALLIHNIGFTIYPDDTAGPISGLGTPKSQRFTSVLQPHPTNSRVQRSKKSENENNQENIPPTPEPSSSTSTASSKTHTPSTTSGDGNEEDWAGLPGSGRNRRVMERSKLGNVIHGSPGEGKDDVEVEEEEELTPGRVEVRRKVRGGREGLRREVDRI